MSKHRSLDKFEAYKPDVQHWVQDTYFAGSNSERFHNPAGYVLGTKRKTGFSYGIQKRMFHASGLGITVDIYHVGKSENS